MAAAVSVVASTLTVLLCRLSLLAYAMPAGAPVSGFCANNVTHMHNFNIKQIRGNWYTDSAGDPQVGISCATVQFSNIDNAGLLVVQKMFKFDGLAKPIEFDAANFFDPEEPSTFIGSYTYSEDEKPSIVDTTVVDTDYKTYMLIHACGYTVHDDPIEGYGILTRASTGLTDARRAELYAKLYQSLGNRGALYVTRRDGCESVTKELIAAGAGSSNTNAGVEIPTAASREHGIPSGARNPLKRALQYLLSPKVV